MTMLLITFMSSKKIIFKMKFLIALISLVIFSCSSAPEGEYKTVNTKTKEQIQTDSLIDAYKAGKFYKQRIIAIDDSLSGFIFLHKENNHRHIPDGVRLGFYAEKRVLMDSMELAIHKMVWALPQMQNINEGDGGYNTKVTAVVKNGDHYWIDLKQDKGDFVNTTPFLNAKYYPENDSLYVNWTR